jgi:hypothetical protein
MDVAPETHSYPRMGQGVGQPTRRAAPLLLHAESRTFDRPQCWHRAARYMVRSCGAARIATRALGAFLLP